MGVAGGGGKALLGAGLVLVLACWAIGKADIDFGDITTSSDDNVGNSSAAGEISIPCEVDDNIGLTEDRLETCVAAKGHAAAQLSPEDFTCLEEMWTRESRWSAWAVNESSGTYGIPQIHPDVHGHPVEMGDWEGQVDWGLAYIERNHNTPCAAWEFWQRTDPRCLPKAEQCNHPYGDHWY